LRDPGTTTDPASKESANEASQQRRLGRVPYRKVSELPDSVKNNLPKHAQEIYKEAFNSAEEQYGEESRAHRVAWSAVENKYEKNENGRWVSKES
jgi:cation transport regulator